MNKIIYLSLLFFVIIAILLIFWFIHLSSDLEYFTQNPRQTSITIKSDNNSVIATYGDIYSGHVDISEISKDLLNAVVSIEDHRFYNHFGVDFRGIVRAIYVNLSEGHVVQGGSTITQQLAKIMFLNSEKSFLRKIRELLITLKLEESLQKEEILSLYLNRAYFGFGNYGVASASKNYFSKSPKELNFYEAAILAATLKAPSRLNPIISIEENIKRAKLVMKKMLDFGYISPKDYEDSVDKINQVVVSKNFNIHDRYFTDWIYRRSSSYEKNSSDIVINTTFNTKIQKYIEKAVLKILRDKELEVAVIVMDTTGAIKGMLGGRSYYKSQYNRATQAKRQPGSVFKLFTYISAFDLGLTVHDQVDDVPLDLEGWRPQNYDKKYRGKISLYEAFGISSNVAAVRIQEIVGRKNIIKWAKKLGISAKLKPQRSLTLGTQVVSLIEMTNAYVPIVSEGKVAFPFGVTEIIDREGNLLYKRNVVSREPIMRRDIYSSMRLILKHSISEGTARRAKPNNLLDRDILIGGKTGTTQNSKDAWFIGYIDNIVIGVWVGRDDNKTTPGLSGGMQPALIFKQIVEKILDG